jgi:hypothetical protein
MKKSPCPDKVIGWAHWLSCSWLQVGRLGKSEDRLKKKSDSHEVSVR